MSTDSPRLMAKLTRPKLFDVLPRLRLYEQLDEVRKKHRAIYVAGPPGAGKTTLIASWLDERGIEGIWMQIDPGDADLATFFHYLGVAAIPFGGSARRPMPALTPEYSAELHGFVRRFFRELFSRLPMGAALVLDNYQEVLPEHGFHDLIAMGVEELPAGLTLVAISRLDPPGAYARLIANHELALIDWGDLKLTEEEAHGIVARRSSSTIADPDKLYRDSEGWAAGLTLLLERGGHAGADQHPGALEAPQRVFDYFATQILRQTSDAHRRMLFKLALVPRVTKSIALALTGEQDASGMLDQFYRRRLFIDRRGGEPVTYTFHAMLRAFLLHEAHAALNPDEITAIQRTGGQLLASAGFLEDAMELHLASGDWHGAAALLAAQGGAMLAAGRWMTVGKWLEALPAQVSASDPWLKYWAGVALSNVDPSMARRLLMEASRLAVERQDTMCQLQCAAAIIESCCIEWTQFSLMDPWIPVLEQAFDDALPWHSVDARLRAMNALLSALAYRAPEHALLPICVERTFSLIGAARDPNIKVVASSTLTNHGGHSGQPRIIEAGLALLDRWIDDPSVSTPNRAAGLFSAVWGRHSLRDAQGARLAITAIERLVEETGLTYAGTFSAFMATCVEGNQGQLPAARQWFERLRARVNPMRWYDRAILCCAAVWLGVYERSSAQALEFGEEGIALIVDGVANSAVQWRWPAAVAHAHRGDAANTHRILADIHVFIERHALRHWIPLCRATEALLSLRLGERGALAVSLADMLHQHRGVEESNLWYLRSYLPELFAVALQEKIDVVEVCRLIRLYDLDAPNPMADPWPWRVKVRLFGGFSLEVENEPVAFRGKIPRKPLALLKALVCFGGDKVPATRLADALWPDQDGDDAMRAFHSALFRLRALLNVEDLLAFSDGCLSLDRGKVWVDALAFQDLCQATRRGDGEAGARAAALYRGNLLADEEAPWALESRERLATLYRRYAPDGESHR